ncbi:hypothetical protein NQ315_004678 [Exocentrus adspersus]|uniref:RNase H type-1 domain-containing protein n=1 Tax=Exocentrus adspersus TaxID=1586481 RepID=A0AAV8V526_9CUCU|nr:hypothetical protein NQ315_004678 [Exocentrus adspersus]
MNREVEKTASTSKDANKVAPRYSPENWSHVSRLLKDRKADYVKAKMIGDNSIAITPATAEDYRLITKVLEADKQEYHTYRDAAPGSQSREAEAGNGGIAEPVPVEKQSQCHRCQKFGHGQSRCTAQPKCVKCGADHETGRCEKSREEPPDAPTAVVPSKETCSHRWRADATAKAQRRGGPRLTINGCTTEMPESLRVASWNIDSFTARKDELQELAENMSTKIPGYVVYRQDRNRRGGGVAVAIKRGIDYYMLQVLQLNIMKLSPWGSLPPVERDKLLEAPSDKILSHMSLRKIIQLRSQAEKSGTRDPDALVSHGLVWFTDGSKTLEGTGAGVLGVRPRGGTQFPLGKHASVFQAEVFVISACVSENLKRGYSNQHIQICTDSQAALHALKSSRIISQVVLECTNSLAALGQRNKVRLVWVPGHSGVAGNEEADVLAPKGSSDTLTGPEPAIGLRTATHLVP